MGKLVLKYSRTKRDFLICFIVISIVFSDILGNGNLNLLYFFGIYLIIKNFKIRITILKDIAIFFLPFCLLLLISFFGSKNSFVPERVLAYILKLFLCTTLLAYTKEYYWRIDQRKIIDLICNCYGFFLILSLATIKFPVLWRLNDSYNSFSKTRLKFLYSEPSVLGIICGVILIILMYYFFNKNSDQKMNRELLVLLIIIILTFSMSGIVYTAIGVTALFLTKTIGHKQRIPRKILILCLVGICALVMVLATSNPISNRLLAMSMGMDGSYNFRWSAAINAYNKIMRLTENWGIGLGNMNTQAGLSRLLSVGMDYKMANSFLYFLTENGFLGMFYIFYLFLICLYHCFRCSKETRSLRVGLFFFVFMSQIAGGYFTDPILWIVYGIVCSRESNNCGLHFKDGII